MKVFGEEVRSRVDGEGEHIGDAPVAIENFERSRVKACALAGRVRRWEERGARCRRNLLPRRFRNSLDDVERKVSGIVPPCARKFGGGEELADVAERTGVGRYVGARPMGF